MAFSSIPEEKPVLKTAIVREWLYAIRNFKPLACIIHEGTARG